jgi:hypothetical protein
MISHSFVIACLDLTFYTLCTIGGKFVSLSACLKKITTYRHMIATSVFLDRYTASRTPLPSLLAYHLL